MALDAVSLMRARGARNSILAGARPRDRIRWRRPVRSLAKAACGRGGPYVFKSRYGLLVLGRMARTRADVREAELLEDLADRALVEWLRRGGSCHEQPAHHCRCDLVR